MHLGFLFAFTYVCFLCFLLFITCFLQPFFHQGTKEGNEIHSNKEQKWVNGSVHDQQYSSCSGTVHFPELLICIKNESGHRSKLFYVLLMTSCTYLIQFCLLFFSFYSRLPALNVFLCKMNIALFHKHWTLQ